MYGRVGGAITHELDDGAGGGPLSRCGPYRRQRPMTRPSRMFSTAAPRDAPLARTDCGGEPKVVTDTALVSEVTEVRR